jgi:hypothetical protein
MMLYLFRNVFVHDVTLRLAHRKGAVSRLPLKPLSNLYSSFGPDRRSAFELHDPIRQRNGPRLTCQQMNMIFHTADSDRRAVEFPSDSCQIAMHLVTQRWIGQERAALFGREDEVDQNVGEGL